jgi:hypothetical protein
MAYGIQRGLEGVNGLHAWQWLFLIEGIGSMIWGVVIWILLPEMPEKEIAKKRSLFFNNPEERELIVMRSEAGMYAQPPVSLRD